MACTVADAMGPVAYEKIGPQAKSGEDVPNYGQNLVILAMRWGEFLAMLEATVDRTGSLPDDWRTAAEVRHIARKARREALEIPRMMPVANGHLGIYQPAFEAFIELSNTEIEVYDAVLRACDARSSGNNTRSSQAAIEEDHALFSVRYIQSLGDDALKSFPRKLEGREETRLTPGDFWWPLAATVSWLVLVLTEGWPLRDWSWVPGVIAHTSPIWYGAIVLCGWLMTVQKLIKRMCEIANGR